MRTPAIAIVALATATGCAGLQRVFGFEEQITLARQVARMLFPSTRQRTIWARVLGSSLFILTIMRNRFGKVNRLFSENKRTCLFCMLTVIREPGYVPGDAESRRSHSDPR